LSWPLIVERLDAQGRVISHVRVQGPSAVIGRGYDCDVVIDDPHVAARHALLQLDEQGQLMIHDMGSINGTWVGPAEQATRSTRDALTSGHSKALVLGHVVKLGLSRLRVLSPTAAVAAEVPLASADGRFAGATSPNAPVWAMVLSILALLGISVAESWFVQVHKFQPATTLSQALATGGGVLLWSGAWALLTRVIRGHSRWLRHAAWVSLVVLLWAALEWVSNTMSFALDWPRMGTWVALLQLLLGVVLLFGHLKLTFDAVSGRARASVVAMALGGLAVLGFYDWQTHRQLFASDFMTSMRPPSWRLASPASTDEHFGRAALLVDKVDSLRPVDPFDSEASPED
jgi:hypothetical protein